MESYYYLKKGEIIQAGDEVEIGNGWHAPEKWVAAGHTVGTPAPDPRYPAHRTYRRPNPKQLEGGADAK